MVVADATIGALGGYGAMTGQTPQINKDVAPGVASQDFIENKNNGADIFKNYAMKNVTTDDVDQRLLELSEKKDSAYADSVKYFKSLGQDIKPAEIRAHVASFHNQLDMEAKQLVAEKEARIKQAGETAKIEFQSKSLEFLNARKKQMGIDQQLTQEATKPISDPTVIADLMTQKQQADTQVEKIKKDFAKKGINEPDAILREGADIQKEAQDMTNRGVSATDQRAILTAKYPDQEVGVVEATSGNKTATADQVLYAVANGKYDDANGSFNAPTFLTDIQKVPEYQGLNKTQIGEKLIDNEDDIGALKDIFYVVHKSTPDVEPAIQKLIDKGLPEEQVIDIVLNGYLKNATTKEQSLLTLNKLVTTLKDMKADKAMIQAIIVDNGLEMNGWKVTQPTTK